MELTEILKTYYPMNFQHTVIGDQLQIDFCHFKDDFIGQKWKLGGIHQQGTLIEFKITEILQKREPGLKTKENPNNVNHHPDGVMWFRVMADIVN
jgi:hypothetical protein